jgi:hypothetical protein
MRKFFARLISSFIPSSGLRRWNFTPDASRKCFCILARQANLFRQIRCTLIQVFHRDASLRFETVLKQN